MKGFNFVNYWRRFVRELMSIFGKDIEMVHNVGAGCSGVGISQGRHRTSLQRCNAYFNIQHVTSELYLDSFI